MADGGLPYPDFVDQNPPLIYLFWGLAQSWFPGEARPLRIAALVSLLTTGLVGGGLARRRGYRRAAPFAGLRPRRGEVATDVCRQARSAPEAA